MSNEELHKRFVKAFEVANQMDIDIPIDLRLQYYAYYKQATDDDGTYKPNDPIEIRNAFKMNAILQVKNLSQDEAKLKYIELVNQTIIKYNLKLNLV
ncbi:MAG: acyl-CoA-binding protein [Flavobacteriaceae bacterium]|nr:acyl-CoA-binding protein [Flavobacteriaceae bacterium]